MLTLLEQFVYLLLLAVPIACVSWTVTHEEVFREPREFCIRKSRYGRTIFIRKFFYLFTCEYCFSHYVTILFLVLTQFRMLYGDWRGYLISGFSLVWIANTYMSLYNRVRMDIKKERTEAELEEEELKEKKQQHEENSSSR